MKAVLFASFGSSYERARKEQIDSVANYIAENRPDFVLRQAYTSTIVRRILEKRGLHVPSVSEALDGLYKEGADEIVVQSGQLLPGEEYEKMCRLAEEKRTLFRKLHIGKPLLSTTEDIQHLAAILARKYPFEQKQLVVLMGHGTKRIANAAYAAMDYCFADRGREDMKVATIEAYPGFDSLLRYLKGKSYQKILLAPLLLVAGDHALNDMAGEAEESWASRFGRAGYETDCRLSALGEMPEVQKMYLERVEQALGQELCHAL